MLTLLIYEQYKLVIVFQRKVLKNNFRVFRNECLWEIGESEKTKTKRTRYKGNQKKLSTAVVDLRGGEGDERISP